MHDDSKFLVRVILIFQFTNRELFQIKENFYTLLPMFFEQLIKGLFGSELFHSLCFPC